MNKTGIFKYPSDHRPVALAVLVVTLSLVPFMVPMAWWALVPYLAFVYFLRSHMPFAQHNQAHLSVFNSSVLNGLYNVILAQCTGYQTALWELHHGRGHHRNFLKPELDVARIVDLKTGRVMSRWMYALRGNLTIHRDSIGIGIAEGREGKKTLLGKLTFELFVQSAITAGLLWWNAPMAIACFIAPNIFASWFIWWESYPHHLHVPTTNLYDGSVTIMNEAYNRATFNIGHHTAHHEKPTLHWSLLPQRTQQIISRIPAQCVHENYDRSARKQAEETLRLATEQAATEKHAIMTQSVATGAV